MIWFVFNVRCRFGILKCQALIWCPKHSIWSITSKVTMRSYSWCKIKNSIMHILASIVDVVNIEWTIPVWHIHNFTYIHLNCLYNCTVLILFIVVNITLILKSSALIPHRKCQDWSITIKVTMWFCNWYNFHICILYIYAINLTNILKVYVINCKNIMIIFWINLNPMHLSIVKKNSNTCQIHQKKY